MLGIPDLDENIRYLWTYFVEVFDGRELSFQELGAWASLTGRKLTPVEISLLKKLAHTVAQENTKDG